MSLQWTAFWRAIAGLALLMASVVWVACGGQAASGGGDPTSLADGADVSAVPESRDLAGGGVDSHPTPSDVGDVEGRRDVRADLPDLKSTGASDVPGLETTADAPSDAVRQDARADGSLTREISEDAPGGALDADATDYFTLCNQPCGCSGDFDPCGVEFWLVQIEWSEQASYPPPPGTPTGEHVILVRAGWEDWFADGEAWPGCGGPRGEPCGGHCIPSAMKVFTLDLRSRTVRLVGNETFDAWRSGALVRSLPSEMVGSEFVLRAPDYGVTLYFRDSVIPGMPCQCLDCLGDHVRAVRVQPEDSPSFWIDFPLVLAE